jgi:heat shock protein HtpX
MDQPDLYAHKNRVRIVGLVVLATVNYVIAAAAAGAAIGLAIVAWILGEAGDLTDLFDGGTFLVVAIGVAVIVGFSTVIGTVVAVFRLPMQRRRLERRVLSETGARVAEVGEHRQVQNLLEALAIAAGIPAPRFALIDDDAPNTFGVGTQPDNTIIGITTGLDELLTRDELEAVLAYEVSRVRSWDVALSSWTVALTGSAIESLETGDLRAIIGWLPLRFARRLQVWALRGVGPERDRAAVRFTRHPQALVDALEKLHADPSQVLRVSYATAPLWIEVPTPAGTASRSAQQLAREVGLENRIAELRQLAGLPPSATRTEPGASPATA